MTHQNSSNYNKETKRYVSLQVEEKTPRVGERKKKEVLSFGQLLSVALVQRRLLWWNWGFACKPHDTSRAQQNREVDHRSNWPQENREKKDVFLGCKTSRKRACFMSILNVIKKKVAPSTLPFFVLSIAVGLSPSYCYQMISRHSSHTLISQIERWHLIIFDGGCFMGCKEGTYFFFSPQ